jgi:hypothetical protein
MIRRNTASQVIYLPALLLKADGAAVTSGATMNVAKDGTEAASAGTLAHYANGVWKYTPTQAETDAAIVGLVLTATNASPVVVNLVTTGADTSAVALGALTTLGTNAPSNWINAAAIAASALNDKGNWNIGKTGYSLTQAFPANFAALGINVSGHVSRVVLVDTTTTNTDMRGTDSALLASSYTAPPSAEDNATQVRTELDIELGRIDATISSRSTFAGGAVDSVTGAVGSVTTPVTVGTNNDKTGYALTQSFPSNFASLGINSSGHVSRVVLVDTTTTNTDVTAVAAEVGKIPRGASAIAAGGNATRTKVSANGTTLVEAIT